MSEAAASAEDATERRNRLKLALSAAAFAGLAIILGVVLYVFRAPAEVPEVKAEPTTAADIAGPSKDDDAAETAVVEESAPAAQEAPAPEPAPVDMTDCDEVGMLCVRDDGTFPGVTEYTTYRAVGERVFDASSFYVFYGFSEKTGRNHIRICLDSNGKCVIPLDTLDGSEWYFSGDTTLTKVSASEVWFETDGRTIVYRSE